VPRPSKYKKEYAKQASKLCKLGATDKELADFFEVSESTLNLWKVTHQEFSESLKAGKAPADDKVEMSLYHRALGYSHPHDDIRVINNEITVTPTRKHYPPDTTACIFWLKNRRPDLWREKTELETPSEGLTLKLIDATAPDGD
jgi:hypothetical protein